MSTCAPEAVCRLESLIADGIGADLYKIWFKNATHFSFADGFIEVAVPNQFVGGWIEKHYAEAIARAAQQVTGRATDVTFSIDAELARRLRKRQADSQVSSVERHPERLARERLKNGMSGMVPSAPALKFTLDTFVVGPSNQTAWAAITAAADSPGTRYSPLFIHGGCGLGKTHLLQGLCNRLAKQRPTVRWHYTSGEDFTNEFIFAVRSSAQDAFRHRYRSVDVLVIDDIHFLANKDKTQEEFLYTYNAIDTGGKQVVMASDAHPKMIGRLSDSLVSRFVAGMVVRVEMPDAATRAEILRRQAAVRRANVPAAVIEFMADRLQTNVREPEGALCKAIMLAEVNQSSVTLDLARRVVDELIGEVVPAVKLADICSAAAIYFGLKPADLHTSRKTRTIALARGIAMYLARKHTDMSFPEIGRFLGNKNHSTVILAERRIKQMIEHRVSVRWSTGKGGETVVSDVVAELESQLRVGRRK